MITIKQILGQGWQLAGQFFYRLSFCNKTELAISNGDPNHCLIIPKSTNNYLH